MSRASGTGTAEAGTHDGFALTRAAHAVAQSDWGDRLARIGLGTRAVVYLVWAVLVARIASGMLGPAPKKPTTGTGVAQAIGEATGGVLMLIILAAGCLLFAMFSLLDAILHHNDETPWGKRWGDRLLSVWGCLLYTLFAIYCLHEAAGSPQSQTAAQSRRSESHLTAEVLGWPGGPVLLGLFGGVLCIIAIFLVTRCIRVTFSPRFDVDNMSKRAWRTVVVLGVGGYVGRAVMFGIVGWFVISAAVQDAPQKSEGIDGAVRRLADTGGGTLLLWVLALGLVLYALFTLAEARYRKV